MQELGVSFIRNLDNKRQQLNSEPLKKAIDKNKEEKKQQQHVFVKQTSSFFLLANESTNCPMISDIIEVKYLPRG